MFALKIGVDLVEVDHHVGLVVSCELRLELKWDSGLLWDGKGRTKKGDEMTTQKAGEKKYGARKMKNVRRVSVRRGKMNTSR